MISLFSLSLGLTVNVNYSLLQHYVAFLSCKTGSSALCTSHADLQKAAADRQLADHLTQTQVRSQSKVPSVGILMSDDEKKVF